MTPTLRIVLVIGLLLLSFLLLSKDRMAPGPREVVKEPSRSCEYVVEK
jgi:hypothetical protein